MSGELRAAMGPIVLTSLLGMPLAGCHPYGCGSTRCVTQHEYDGALHCFAVHAVAAELVPSLPPTDQAAFSVGSLQDAESEDTEGALSRRAQLGFGHDAIFRQLQLEKTRHLETVSASPRAHLASLLRDEVKRCAGDLS
jgi:hypothetical protein